MAEGDPARGVRLAWGGLVVTAGLTALAGWLALAARSFPAAGAAAHLAVGVVVWLAILVDQRRSLRAAREGLETARLASLVSEGRRPLFEAQQAQAEGEAALARFRRFGYPVATVAVAALELSLAWLLERVPHGGPTALDSLGAALFGGAAFLLLVLGRYAFALARADLPLAAAGARRATSAALGMFVAGVALAARHRDLPQADLLGYLFVGTEGLLGLEALALLLLDAYRPRRTGEEARPPFDSRLLGLLSSPGDLARSIARAVDYQFGFSLSQTWLYRFLERWIVPLVGFAAVAFWLLSGLVVVHPGEVALVRRFGRTLDHPLGPGLHLKLPWPVDAVQKVPTGRVLSVSTGHHVFDKEPGMREVVLSWTRGHHTDAEGDPGEDLVLIPRQVAPGESAKGDTPVNLLTAEASVQYQVRDPVRLARRVRDPGALVEVLTERELAFLLGGEDLDRLLRSRGRYALRLGKRVQVAADQVRLGVKVREATLTDLHPPVEVGRAFEGVTEALERSKAEVVSAQRQAEQVHLRAQSQVARILVEARAAAYARVTLARADAARFDSLRALDRAAPGVYRITRLLQVLSDGAAGKRKFVIGRPGVELTDLNLQEKVSAAALNLGQQVATRVCPRCGAQIPKGATVCPRCGFHLPKPEKK